MTLQQSDIIAIVILYEGVVHPGILKRVQGAKMRQKSVPEKEPATQVMKNIGRQTRRHFLAEDKVRIVREGVRPLLRTHLDG